jgi:hypothetical protein
LLPAATPALARRTDNTTSPPTHARHHHHLQLPRVLPPPHPLFPTPHACSDEGCQQRRAAGRAWLRHP